MCGLSRQWRKSRLSSNAFAGRGSLLGFFSCRKANNFCKRHWHVKNNVESDIIAFCEFY